MAVQLPSSMSECLYFTNRTLSGKHEGSILAWVYRKPCPKCKQGSMGKPVEKGKVKTRAAVYVCPSCDYTEEKIAHEESLTLEAKYRCSNCGKEGQSSAPYKRKNYLGVQAYVIDCQHCDNKIPLTKKLKNIKKKGKAEAAEDDEDLGGES